MSKMFTGRLGVLKESYRSGERIQSVGLCTLQVPADAIEAMGLKPGDQYRSERSGDYVLLRKSKMRNSSEKFQIREPETIRFRSMYMVNIETNRVAMSSVDYPLTDIELEFDGSYLFFAVPSELRSRGTPRPKKVPERRVDLVALRRNHQGTAYAVALEAARYGNKQHPLHEDQLVTLLRNAGHRLSQMSPRLWSLDGKTAVLADLVERARRIDADAIFVAEAA